jgi:hypothetical protein
MKPLNPNPRPKPQNAGSTATGLSEQPLRICVVFDEEASARSAAVLIRQVAPDCPCDTRSFRFDELAGRKPGVTAARNAADADILLLAARGDRTLPAHVRFWLGLCLGLRDRDQAGAFVAVIANGAGTARLHSSIVDYLATLAVSGGMAFFPQQPGVPEPANDHRASALRTTGRRLNSSGGAGGRATCLPAREKAGGDSDWLIPKLTDLD